MKQCCIVIVFYVRTFALSIWTKTWFDVKKAYGQKRRLNPKSETEYEEKISMNENQV